MGNECCESDKGLLADLAVRFSDALFAVMSFFLILGLC